MVLLEYTGRLVSDGRIFDTTDEETAKRWGIFEPSARYGPRYAIVGAGVMIRGMEAAISAATVGSSADFQIPASMAFGERSPGLVRMMPERDFAKQGVRVAPGMTVTLDNSLARVKSVTSGRVVVDFNHPLAGEEVVYSLKLVQVISEDPKKAEAVLANFGLKGKAESADGKLAVTFQPNEPADKVREAKSALRALFPEIVFSG